MTHPNIFHPRNDWNIRSLKCKKELHANTFERMVANEIKSVLGINPFAETEFRGLEYVQARQIFLSMMYHHTKRTLRSIGSIVGKDHATVLHSVKTTQNLCDTDKRFKEKYQLIHQRIKLLN